MRRSWIVLLGIAWVGTAAWAAPRLSVSQGVYDFGEVAEGLLLPHTFILRNTGSSPLAFTQQPTTTCGCVTVVPLGKMILAPGEEIRLLVRVDTTGYGGRRVSQPVYVYSNDPTAQTLTLTVQGFVRPSQPYEGSATTLQQGFYLLVDLRPPDAFARGRLLGAINIPLAKLPDWLPRLPKNHAIYVYDETGAQAIQAAQVLRQHGFVAAFAVSGGLVGWWRDLGDLFFVWAEGAARTPPAGTAASGAYTLPASRIVAQGYQVILDLRPREAYALGNFPGSLNLKLLEVPHFAMHILPSAALASGYTVSVWCVDEDGSTPFSPALQTAQYLQALGFPHAKALTGGLPQWRIRFGDELLWPETPK